MLFRSTCRGQSRARSPPLASREPEPRIWSAPCVADAGPCRALRLGPGTLYGAITRLEERGWIRALESEDRRRPYAITGAGKQYLEEQLAALDQVVKTAMRRLRPA